MILLEFKVKQHLIYIVIAVLVGILFKLGVFLALTIFIVYWRRFPKTYWLYFLFSFGAMIWLTLSLQEGQVNIDEMEQERQAIVQEIRHQSDAKQTVIIQFEGHSYYFSTIQTAPKLRPGNRIQFSSKITLPMQSTIPHAFDFKKYLKGQGISMTMTSTAFEVLDHQFDLRQVQYDIGNWVSDHFPNRTASYIKALLLGINEDLGEEMKAVYSNLGIIHLFAISGLHVGLLSGMLQFVLKRLGLIEELTDVVVMIFIIFFCILSGASVSVIRAGSMFILLRLNQRFKWQWSSLDLFSMVFLTNFILDPTQVFQVGFIYSYWLTAMLICFQSQFKQLSRQQLFFYLPFIAQLVSLPLQLFFNYYINPLSYLMNLFLIPFVSTIGLPLLILICFIPPLAPLLEKGLVLFEQLIITLDTSFNMKWITGQFSLTFLMVILCLFLVGARWIEKQGQKKNWIYVMVAIVLLLELNRFFKPAGQFTMLDVGQGDSTVIQSPYHQCNIIVDTGGKVSFNSSGGKSIFEDTLKPYLMGEGIRTIDHLIISHGDWDHMGEVIPLLQTFKVREIIINQFPLNEHMQDIVDEARKLKIKIRKIQEDEILVCGNQKLTFLGGERQAANENDASLVFYLQMNHFTAFLSGDISQKIESVLLKNYRLAPADIYKAAHHGSKTSNSAMLIEKINPKLVLVSAGRNNRYHHPSKEVINQLNEMKIPLLSTQAQGSIQLRLFKDSYSIFIYPPY